MKDIEKLAFVLWGLLPAHSVVAEYARHVDGLQHASWMGHWIRTSCSWRDNNVIVQDHGFSLTTAGYSFVPFSSRNVSRTASMQDTDKASETKHYCRKYLVHDCIMLKQHQLCWATHSLKNHIHHAHSQIATTVTGYICKSYVPWFNDRSHTLQAPPTHIRGTHINY